MKLVFLCVHHIQKKLGMSPTYHHDHDILYQLFSIFSFFFLR